MAATTGGAERPFTKPFHRALRDARFLEKPRLTARDAAFRACVSEAVYESWETGAALPTKHELERIFGKKNHRTMLLARQLEQERAAASAAVVGAQYGHSLAAIQSSTMVHALGGVADRAPPQPQTPFCVLLRERRELLRYSVHRCAEAARVPESQWKAYERGDDIPTRMQVRRVFGGTTNLLALYPKDGPAMPDDDALPVVDGPITSPIMVWGPPLAPAERRPPPPRMPSPPRPPVAVEVMDPPDVAAHLDAEDDPGDDYPPATQGDPPGRRPLTPAEAHALAAHLALAPAPDLADAESFGDALRVARTANRLDQYALAELVGVTQSTVSSWERGDTVPVRENLRLLLDLMPELRGAPTPPSRDIPKPGGPEGWTLGKHPARGPDSSPRAEPASAPAPAAAEVPLPPDGLDLLARAVRVASSMGGAAYRAHVDFAGPDVVSVAVLAGTAHPRFDGSASSPRIALGQVLDAIRAEVERKRVALRAELDEKRRALEEEVARRQAELDALDEQLPGDGR